MTAWAGAPAATTRAVASRAVIRVARKVDERIGARARSGDADHPGRRGRACRRLRRIDIVGHRKIRGLRLIDDLHPDAGAGGVVGEANLEAGLPGHGCNLQRAVAEHQAGSGARAEVVAGEQSASSKGIVLARNPIRNMCRTRSADPNRWADHGPYGWRSVNEDRYYTVDVRCRARKTSGCALEILRQRPVGQGFGQMQPADPLCTVEIGQRPRHPQHAMITARRQF